MGKSKVQVRMDEGVDKPVTNLEGTGLPEKPLPEAGPLFVAKQPSLNKQAPGAFPFWSPLLQSVAGVRVALLGDSFSRELPPLSRAAAGRSRRW